METMEEDENIDEVEDIMCDQVIISTEVEFKSNNFSTITISATKLRLAVTILADTFFPTIVGVYYAYLRNQKTVVENVRHQILPTVLALIANYLSRSLSSVQRGIYLSRTLRQLKPAPRAVDNSSDDELPEKCVECDILIEPEGPIRADIIFVHGLHGSLSKTWKQGLWFHEKHKLRREQFRKSLQRGLSIGDISRRNRTTSLKRPVAYPSMFAPCKIPRKNLEDSINNCFVEDENWPKPSRKDYTPCWPQDWLPIDCPGVRVIALNYTTDPYLWRPLWVKKRNRTSMVERSKEMIDLLVEKDVGKYPIIWVGHSKGGLFIKQIILHSWDESNFPGIGDIYAQSKAILFYSVPHKGSIFADFNLPLLRRSIELTEIQRNCPFVLNLHERFLKIIEDTNNFNPQIFSFIETSFTLMSFIYLKIVAYESADPGVGHTCGVPLDHREICKPAGRHCFLYKELVNLVNNVFYNIEYNT